MEKDQIINSMKNPNFLKDNIFLDYFNYNNNPITNKEFIKPKLEAFDKYFIKEENSPKDNNFKSTISVNGVLENNLEGEEDNNYIYNHIDEQFDESNFHKKQLFNNMNQKFNIEDLRKKKLIMNRESAKKSRLKKKKYIENLEKEFIILKEELIRLKSNQISNKYDKNNNDFNPNKIIDNIIKNQNINNNLNNKEKEIFDLKKEEIYILGNSLEKNEEIINKYIIKQKKVLPYLLVKQINIMTPNKIKAFENKFLKLQTFEVDDSIEVIKNKINDNLNTIIELYDIDENNKNNDISKKNTSMSYQLYDFYNSLKAYVNQYDILLNTINDI